MSTWRFVLDDDPADVSAGSGELFDKRMLAVPQNQGGIAITVPFGTTKDAFFYSDAGEPGNPDWPVGAWALDLDVLVANVRITAEIFVNRVAADGTVIENYGPGTAPLILGSIGIKHFSGTTVAQMAAPLPDSTHRLRLGIKLTHDGTPGSQSVTIGFGDPAEGLDVPIQVLTYVSHAHAAGEGQAPRASTGSQAAGATGAGQAPKAAPSSQARQAIVQGQAPAAAASSSAIRASVSAQAPRAVTPADLPTLRVTFAGQSPRMTASGSSPQAAVTTKAPKGQGE